METEQSVVAETINSEVTTQEPAKEKKHDMAWVIAQILLKGAIVTFPAYIVLMVIGAIIAYFFGLDITTLLEKASTDPEFAKQLNVVDQLITFLVMPAMYYGFKWGCKHVSSKTAIDEKDFGKIGYWIGLVPIAASVLFGGSIQVATVIFGIFVTPKYIKKTLTKYINA